MYNSGINSGKPAFGNRFNTYNSGDYLLDKKAQLLYGRTCDPSQKKNSPFVTRSQGNYLLMSRAIEVDNSIDSLLGDLNTFDLASGLYTTEELIEVNTVTEAFYADASCNLVVTPTVQLTPGKPFYYKYRIDPCGELFGNTACGYNNFTRFRVVNKCLF